MTDFSRVTTWVTGFSDKFVTRLLSDEAFIADYLHMYQERLEARRNHAMASLRSIGVPFAVNNAGIFLWVDLSKWLPSFSDPDHGDSSMNVVQGNASLSMKLSSYLMTRGVFLQPDDVSIFLMSCNTPKIPQILSDVRG